MDWILDLIRVEETAEATALSESWLLTAACVGVVVGVFVAVLLFRRRAAANTPAERLLRFSAFLFWVGGTCALALALSIAGWFMFFAGSYLVRPIGVIPGGLVAALASVLPLVLCLRSLRHVA